MKKIIISIFILLLVDANLHAQSLAVNTDGSTAHASALVDVKSTTRGMLIPRMSKTEKNAIASPATGLLIFQNAPDSTGFYYYNGSGWTWLANNVTPQDWLINGNNNITSTNYLGTNTNTDLQFAVNTIVRSRLSSSSGFWGFGGESNPQYELDASMGSAAVFPCTRNGLRLKPVGMSNGCDNGFFIGLDNNNSVANASIWNYGNNLSGAQALRFGLNNFEMMRVNSSGFEGLGESDPKYTFDMKLGISAVYPCTRNGIRMNNTSNNNDCDRGLFIGYDNNNLMDEASFWNFGDGSAFPSGYVFRFGMGSDFTNGEKMRITANGIGIGSTSPHAKIHIVDRTTVLLPGVMVTSPAQPVFEDGFYSGLKDNSGSLTGRIWNYQNANIEFGTNNTQQMIITSTGSIGIGTVTPGFLLEVSGTAGKPGGGSWSVTSDARLKEHVQPYTDGLSTLLLIKPVIYHYNKASGYDTKPEYVGVLAQDIKPIAPYMVGSFKKNGEDFYNVDNSAMTYMLINAIKELKQEIDDLKKRVEK